MNNSFNDLGISAPILQAIAEMGFETPTEVQSIAIPHILNNEDLIVRSKTGSGKTAVFGVSILQMTDPAAEGPQSLILTPTRELAVQIDSDLRQMAKHLRHRTAVVYGQHNMNAEIQMLKRGVSIVTGTPGRIYDHIEHGNLQTKHIRFLVLDEADRMLDMGFIDQVMRIIKKLPKDRVTLLFSATIPDEVHRICSEHMKNPVTIEIESQTKTVDTVEQMYYRVEHNEKRTQLNRLLLMERPESCMIFCNTRIAVDRVQSFLMRKGYASQALHGEIPQARRMKTMQQFKQGDFHILVATDVAARGIHIEGLSLVINYDVPVEKDSYVHRIGRTGRAGHTGRAVSLVTSDDIMSLYAIEEHINAMIPEAELPSEAELNKHSPEIAAWTEANLLKAVPPRAIPDSGAKVMQRKPSRPRPARSAESGKTQQTATDTGYNKRNRTDKGGDYKTRKAAGFKMEPYTAKAAAPARSSGTNAGKYTGSGYARTQALKSDMPVYAGTQALKSDMRGTAHTNPQKSDRPVTSGRGVTVNGKRRTASTGSAATQAMPAAPVQNTSKKVSFIRRVVNKILGKQGKG